MMSLSPLLNAGVFLLVATAILVPSAVRGQADCDAPVFYPAGVTCSGGSADGRPCYVQDTGDNFGCPGGTCVSYAGGGRATYYTAGTGACGIPSLHTGGIYEDDLILWDFAPTTINIS